MGFDASSEHSPTLQVFVVKGLPEPEKVPLYLIPFDSIFSVPSVSRLPVLQLTVELDNNWTGLSKEITTDVL